MNHEEALNYVNDLFIQNFGKHLNPAEERVIELSLEGKKYEQMNIGNYTCDYIKKGLAYRLWKKLSLVILEQEKGVSKQNLKIVLESALKKYKNSSLQGEILLCRYQIINILSSTEFANTYLAQDLDLNKQCVVKELLRQFDEKAIKQFEREVAVLYQLGSHPQIQSLIDHKEEKDKFYLFYQWTEGKVLSEELSEERSSQPWSEKRVLSLLQDILKILKFIHKKGVIHRDIRPSNLIEAPDGIVLINFGSLKKQGLKQELTFNTGIGKLGYMSPEQAYGIPRFSSDIYSLGIVCIQALTGKPPKQLKVNRDSGELIWRKQIKVSPEFCNIVDKMVSRDFKQRHNSVEEVLQDLKKIGSAVTLM